MVDTKTIAALAPNVGFTFTGTIENQDDLAAVQIVQSIDESGNAVYAAPAFTWAEFVAEKAVQQTAFDWENLRAERDKRLAETDWWANSDRTMTAEQTAYRQALRNLPANTTDPANPVWPTKP
jgi:hypothetical protein